MRFLVIVGKERIQAGTYSEAESILGDRDGEILEYVTGFGWVVS